MNPAAIISQYIREHDGTDPDDESNGERRSDLLNELNLVNTVIHNFAMWPWTIAITTNFTVDAGQLSEAVPAAFLAVGQHGGLYDSNGKKWNERSISFITRLRYTRLNGNNQAYRSYCLMNGLITFPYTFGSANFVFPAFVYKIKADTLADDATEMRIPDEWKDPVIIPALTARGQRTKDDPRTDWLEDLRDTLSQMMAIMNPEQSRTRRIPMAYRPGSVS